MKKKINLQLCCLLLVFSFSNSVEAQLDSISYRKKVMLSAGIAVNQLQYGTYNFSKLATKSGVSIDFGFHYRAALKTDLAFNFSRTIITVDKEDPQFDKITFRTTNPMNIDLILVGFKTFVGEGVTFFFMPQFGFVIMNYGILDAVNEQQENVFRKPASSKVEFALAAAAGSDIRLRKRIVLSVMAQYLISSKEGDDPIYQSFNASVGIGYQFK